MIELTVISTIKKQIGKKLRKLKIEGSSFLDNSLTL